jgi:hypothetical protein
MSTTEDRRPQPAAVDDWTDRFSRTLQEHRQRARQLLLAKRERLRRRESTLIEQTLDKQRAELDEARRALNKADDILRTTLLQLDDQRRELETGRLRLDEQRREVAIQQAETKSQRRRIARELRSQRSELAAACKNSQQESKAACTQELTDVLAEKQELLDRLADTESRLRDAEAVRGDAEELEVLRSRFELAVQDVRELKTRNAELEEELEELRQSSSARPNRSVPAAGLNWEAQKRNLLEQLEADFDDGDPRQSADKLTVAGAIRITDQVVVEKEQEIRELEKLLHEKTANIGGLAIGAAAVAEMLDHDELIRDERKNLKRLQDEWREKLRQAEVEISVERAKMARERNHMEEKLQAYERQLPKSQDGSVGDSRAKPATHGRWLTRLGLKNGDEQ